MKNLFTLLLICFTISSIAQNFNWISTAGYSNQIDLFYGAIEIEKDLAGNFYTFDIVTGDQNTQGLNISIESNGLNTIIYKFNSQGNIINGNVIGGNFNFCAAEIDDHNNLYVLGNATNGSFKYRGETYNLDLGSFKQVLIKLNSAGELIWFYESGYSGLPNGTFLEYNQGEIFLQSEFTAICSVDTTGELVNVLPFYYETYQSQEASLGLAFKGNNHFSNGDLLIAAAIKGKVSWIEGDTISSASAARSIILTRFTRDFLPVWSKLIPNIEAPDSKFIPVAIGANDEVYIGVELLGSFNFAGNTLTCPASTVQSAVLSFLSDGTENWAAQLSSSGSNSIHAMEFDPFQSLIWFTGSIQSTTTFGDTTILIDANQIGNSYLTALNPQGEFTQCFSPNSSLTSEGKSLCVLNAEQVLTGFRNTSTNEHQWSCLNFQNKGGLIVASYRIDDFEPIVPNVTLDGNILQVNFTGNIQWFLDGLPIDTAQSQMLTVLNSGIYSVQLDYPGDCIDPAMSIPISISIENIELTTNSELQLSVLNNKLLISNAPSGSVFNLYAIDGKLIKSGEIHSKYIEVEPLNAGLYILQLQADNKSSVKKLMVQ